MSTDNQLKDTHYGHHYHKIFNITKKPYYEPRFYIYIRGTLYIESKNFYRLLWVLLLLLGVLLLLLGVELLLWGHSIMSRAFI